MTAYCVRSARAAVCVAAIPIDERGFLIPWFVATIDGKPHLFPCHQSQRHYDRRQ